MKVAIIGTAGRKVPTGQKIDEELFSRMTQTVINIINRKLGQELSDITLISGAAALSDHIATVLVDKISLLLLEVPCNILQDGRFYDKGEYHWKVNPGKTANSYHQNFSNNVGIDSFHDIAKAVKSDNCVVNVHNGFHERNDKIANDADYLIAFSWSTSEQPTDGGTKYTWGKAKCSKIHIPLWLLREENWTDAINFCNFL